MLRRTTNQVLLAVLLDLSSVLVALKLADWMRFNLPYGRPIWSALNLEVLSLGAILIYLLIFLVVSLYDPDRSFRPSEEYKLVIRASLIADLALAGLVFFTTREISRLFLVYFYILHITLVVGWRIIAQYLLRKNRELRKVLIVGGGETACRTLERLNEMDWSGIHIIGYITNGEPIDGLGTSIPRLGRLEDVVSVVQRHAVDDVLLAIPAESYNQIQQLTTRLIDKPCTIWLIPDYFSLLLYGPKVDDLGGVPLISLKTPSLTGYQRVVKRVLDISIVCFFAFPFLPLMALIALAIKLDSPGGVLFKQIRVGENGRMFWMYKFRSMVDDAEQQLKHLIRNDDGGNIMHKFSDDPRITRVGKFIRRTSLDELPQLYNVLKGEMSIVGPRPELPLLVESYETWQHIRLAVPPGITGWWQINGRSDKPMHLHTEDDLYYVKNYSLKLDLQILLRTPWVVFRRKGAF